MAEQRSTRRVLVLPLGGAAHAVLGGHEPLPEPPGRWLVWFAVPTLVGMLLIALATLGLIP